MLICLEGPSGSGKSTMARRVAAEIGATVIEGGVWYRSLAYLALEEGIKLDDLSALLSLLRRSSIELSVDISGVTQVHVNGNNATQHIYLPSVTESVAAVASHRSVRTEIEPLIIAAAQAQSRTIMVGRNMKSAFPDLPVLRVIIDEQCLQRRNSGRDDAASLANRNKSDRQTKAMLGEVIDGVTEVDVSDMSVDQQAEVLRIFIRENFNKV
jgi:cytidylate kinase